MSRGPRPSSRPYLCYCQICGIQGHTAKRCQFFQIVPISTGNQVAHPTVGSSNTWQPQAQFASNNTTSNQPWLLDTGASYHITTDLTNLSLHQPYTGTNDVMIGDGTGHQITHMGSVSLPYKHSVFKLDNVLCVPDMQKNLISISKFCITNNTPVEFLPYCFYVKDLQT